MNLSKIDSCTRARDGQVQTSPLLKANKAKPSSALSRNASSASITSAMKMFGDLPPSSMVLGIRFSAAYCMICRPVVVSPVKLTLAMRGLEASGAPTSEPWPNTTFSTPGGRTSPISSIRMARLSGVSEAGLITTQLPVASAGAIFHAAIKSGKFHGMICPTTPIGSLKW